MDGLVKIGDLMEYMRNNNLLITTESELHHRLACMEQEKKKSEIKMQRWVSVVDIAAAGVWGNITKKAVYLYAVKHCKDAEILIGSTKSEPTKVNINAVKRLALKKGCGWS